MYVHDISSIVWEILRLRRCKVVIINSAFRSALQNLLGQLLGQANEDPFEVGDAERSQFFSIYPIACEILLSEIAGGHHANHPGRDCRGGGHVP
jgi:hypothetical protein